MGGQIPAKLAALFDLIDGSMEADRSLIGAGT
jgi:hypothetical protein